MKRYEAVPRRYYRNLKTGLTASIYGAAPWTSDADAINWRVVEEGWTVHDKVENTTGAYACPAGSSKEHAEAVAERLNDVAEEAVVRSLLAQRNSLHVVA